MTGPALIALVQLGVFVVALGVAAWTRDPTLAVLLGVAASKAQTVIDYYFGSSAGSRAKDEIIARGNGS